MFIFDFNVPALTLISYMNNEWTCDARSWAWFHSILFLTGTDMPSRSALNQFIKQFREKKCFKLCFLHSLNHLLRLVAAETIPAAVMTHAWHKPMNKGQTEIKFFVVLQFLPKTKVHDRESWSLNSYRMINLNGSYTYRHWTEVVPMLNHVSFLYTPVGKNVEVRQGWVKHSSKSQHKLKVCLSGLTTQSSFKCMLISLTCKGQYKAQKKL
jgi:hypothetical protein